MSETGIETAENVYEGSISGYRRDPYSFDERTFAKAKASFCDMVVAVNDMPPSLMLSIPATVHFANEEAKLTAEIVGALISRIEIYADKRVKIIFSFTGNFMRPLDVLPFLWYSI